ncbi:MAG TPA: hypothetical protein VFQ61_13440, partial [Polyangiaceae bacterium]|nr:hypothetical protein [Polyangiaceae bacterium]
MAVRSAALHMAQGLRVLFISPLFSPFQIEVGEALNRCPGIDYRAVFPMRLREGRRQPHWARYDYDASRYEVMPEAQEPEAWLVQRIRELRPDVLISGQSMGPLYSAVLRTWPEQEYRLGFWMEPPDPFKPAARRVATKELTRLRLSLADFVFGIGLRAEQFYRSCAPQADVTLVPYGEDLSACFAASERDKPSDKLSFLFSGQLIPRHNIPWIL